MFEKYRRLLAYIGPFRKRRIFIVILCSFSIVIGTFIPYMIGKLINLINDGSNINQIVFYGIFTIVVSVVDGLLNAIQNYHWHIYATEYINYFRTLMLDAALKKDISFYRNSDEDYSTRIIQDSHIIAEDISIGFPMLILNVLRLVVVIFFMIRISPLLSILPVIVVPIYILIFHRIDKSLREGSKDERESYSLVNKSVKEYLDGILEIKINQKESFFLDNFRLIIKDYSEKLKKIKKYQAISLGASSIITNILPILVLILGGILVNRGQMELGYLFSFYSYLSFLYEPMSNLVDWYTNLNISLGMSDRIIDFLEEKDSVDGGIPISDIDYIKANNLSFSYGDRIVFDNLNFEINKGDIVCIIGESGSGKSTLLEIILKILTNYNGEIKINNIELKDISRDSLYKYVSLIRQEPFIFNGSIASNITFEKDIVSKKIIEICNLGKILNAKNGLISGEYFNRNSFSGGEKQRIALARALSKDSKLLILDEFTSALDIKTEKDIVDRIDKMDKTDKIILMVSHRKYPLKLANKIIDLSKEVVINE